MDHKIVSTFNGSGMAFTADVDGHKIITDTAGEDGTNQGGSPKKLMLVALAGCTGVDIVSILRKMKVEFSEFTISVEADLTEEHPRIYKDVIMHYSIRTIPESRSKMERAVELSMEKYCGVSAMFEKFTSINKKITFL